MPISRWVGAAHSLPGAPGVRELRVPPDAWRQAARDAAAIGGRLLAMWASGTVAEAQTVRAALAVDRVVLVLALELPAGATYPGLENLFPAATRMQRAIADLSGAAANDPDGRPWLRHAVWRASFRPLADALPESPCEKPVDDDYAFVRVEGDGVHEIPVGPVHAGIIEPGHFRFSVVGEKVLRLEERLGYVHKGIERRFRDFSPVEGSRLAARVSGDSTVAHSWAYCQALEGIAGLTIPARAAWLRATALELERIANHLGDLGALGNDAGFAFGLAQFSRLKELLLRATREAFGRRYLFDFVAPGGVDADLSDEAGSRLGECTARIAAEAGILRQIYDEHSGLRDRFSGAGTVSPSLARQLGLIGLAGRASGQDLDLRIDMPCEPYTGLTLRKAMRTEGDVAARVAVRFDELFESCGLISRTLRSLPPGEHRVPVEVSGRGGIGIGLIEGWRGPVLNALEVDAAGGIVRCHPHDPSWQNWPALEHAIISNIVPDFPLINKSFNLSYSGHDL